VDDGSRQARRRPHGTQPPVAGSRSRPGTVADRRHELAGQQHRRPPMMPLTR
jgi:hypothetical protein